MSSRGAFDVEVQHWLSQAPPTDTVETDGELAANEIALETAHALRGGRPVGAGIPRAEFRRPVQHQKRAPDRRTPPEDVGGGAGKRPRLRCDRLQPRGGGGAVRGTRPALRTWCTGWT